MNIKERNSILNKLVGILCYILSGILIFGMVTTGFVVIFSGGSIYTVGKIIISLSPFMYGLFNIIFAISVLLLFSHIVRKENHFKLWVFGLVLLGFVFRLFAILFWKIDLVSDFLITYSLSTTLASSPISTWGSVIGGIGTIYANEWSAHMPFVIYQTIALFLFGKSVVSIQITNAIASALTILFCVLIAKSIFSKRAGLIVGFIMAIQPTFIFFMPVLTNQSIATLFFIMAIWFFVSMPFKNIWLNIGFASLATALSQLMRPEMYIVLIASVCCFVYYTVVDKTKWAKNLGLVALYIGVFFGIMLIVDMILSRSGIIHGSIMNGNLKYKILVGLNKEKIGMWNEADALAMYNQPLMDTLLKERLSNPLGILLLMIKKLSFQFGSYVYWWAMIFDNAKSTFISQNIYRPLTQAIMDVVIFFATVTMIKDKKDRDKLFVIYIILAGFFATFAVIEMQERYNYLIIPILIILSSKSLSDVNFTKNRKNIDIEKVTHN